MVSCGVGSTVWNKFLRQNLEVLSWNTRALLCLDPVLRSQKLKYLQSIVRPQTIVCLQETHGWEEDVELAMRFLEQTFIS